MKHLVARALDTDFGVALVILGGTYAGIIVLAAIGWQVVLALKGVAA